MGKRKYNQVRREVSDRYDAKTYRKINIALRLDDDQEIIDSMDDARANGVKLREWLSNIYHYGGKPIEVIPQDLVKKDDVERALLAARVDIRTVRQIMKAL